ncbi:hypothetical protein PUN28_001230 [Cardiocondyla obscurior]|uniref:Secreted protein n=1 Tax=Cardiocondyla obscurior TaxID=286306 RepID=A0AAW2H4K9_9HYME
MHSVCTIAYAIIPVRCQNMVVLVAISICMATRVRRESSDVSGSLISQRAHRTDANDPQIQNLTHLSNRKPFSPQPRKRSRESHIWLKRPPRGTD